MDPSDSRYGPLRFRFLIRIGWCSSTPPQRVSSTGLLFFRNMPPLLPRKATRAASVFQAQVLRPSPCVHWVDAFNQLTRLPAGSLALRPAALPFGNSRPSVAGKPLPRTTGVRGQSPGRDFNPLDQAVVTAYGRPLYFIFEAVRYPTFHGPRFHRLFAPPR